MRLTEEQKKMVEDNHGLIMWYLNENDLPYEEYYDICAIAMCRAAIRFNPENGVQFSTYATKAMENEIKSYHRNKHASVRNNHSRRVSLSTQVRSYDDNEKLTLSDVIADSGFGGKSPEDIVMSRSFTCSLTEREAMVVQMVIDGYTYREIGAEIGCTHQNVHRIMSKAKEKLRKEA